MRHRFFSGFTLTELMVVVVIVGILAALVLPNYTATREKALDKEAIAGLKLIRTAERQYFGRQELFYPNAVNVSDITLINANLSTDLAEDHWDYSVVGGATTLRARAVRAGRTWTITNAAGDPTCAGTCY